jgi:hypothetical protein
MRTLAAGFRALSHGKLILLLALTTALLGLAAAIPLAHAIGQDLGGTLAGEHILLNHPTFAPSDVLDFFQDNASAIDGTQKGATVFVILTLLSQMFFAGGMVVVLGRGPFAFSQFFEPARRNWWHNVKCFFLFAILACVVFGVFFGAGYAAHKKLFEDAPPGAAGGRIWDWGFLIVGVLLWGVVSLLYDFARAARRYDAGIGAWRAWGFARRALRGSWIRGLILFLFWFLLGGAAWLAAIAAAWYMPAASPLAIAILLLLQFLSIYVRSAVRVAAWGSYVEFLDHRAAAAMAPRRASYPGLPLQRPSPSPATF